MQFETLESCIVILTLLMFLEVFDILLQNVTDALSLHTGCTVCLHTAFILGHWFPNWGPGSVKHPSERTVQENICQIVLLEICGI